MKQRFVTLLHISNQNFLYSRIFLSVTNDVLRNLYNITNAGRCCFCTKCYNFSKWRRLFLIVLIPKSTSISDSTIPKIANDAHYNTDGVLCPHYNQSCIIRALLIATFGKYYCSKCDFKRPGIELCSHCIKWIIPNRFFFFIWYWRYNILNSNCWTYNIYNALLTLTFRLSTEETKGFSKAQRVFNGQETFTVEDKDVMLV